ncbi:endo-1,4-beta-xylanase [Paenibacillus cremeus]|uniref:endo-1,4-beta-xylanase n=1 Tax=Paenibacillus cremeus TaxID=2163881 RepID=UPI0021BD0393|nr:endo-1,4-beta-xylanase [Paenibacillus cremeus]
MRKWSHLILFAAVVVLLINCTGCDTAQPAGKGAENSSVAPVRGENATKEVTTLVQDIPSIAQVYADYFPIGAAIQPDMTTGKNAEIIKKHFNSVVAETRMKWQPTEPTENKFTFTDSDLIVNFAKENHMKVRGHTLIWHTAVPSWVFQDVNGKEMTEPTEENKALLRQRMENHIKNVVTHFGDDVYAWDVVNEAIDEKQPDGFRNSKWYQILGPEYIEDAFEYAHKYAPNAKLYINEYETHIKKKRQFLYDLVKGLKSKGIQIDGVGHQSHFNVNWPATLDVIGETLEMFAGLGVDNQITELDVSVYQNKSVAGNSTLSQVLAEQQGNRYHDLFDLFRREKTKGRITGVTLWGIADDHTWLTTKSRKDFPLLFDEQLKPKRAYWGVINLN